MKDERLDDIDVVRIDKKAGRVHILGTKYYFSTRWYHITCSLDTGSVFSEEVWKTGFWSTNITEYYHLQDEFEKENLRDFVESLDESRKITLREFGKFVDEMCDGNSYLASEVIDELKSRGEKK